MADLFDLKTCGGCVHRNAAGPNQDVGYCMPKAEMRHKGAKPCDQWFGLAQLQAKRYG